MWIPLRIVRSVPVPSSSVNWSSFLDFLTATHSFTFTARKSDLLNVSKSTSPSNKGSTFTLEKSILSFAVKKPLLSPEGAASAVSLSADLDAAPPRVFIVGSFFAPAVKSCKMIYISLNHYNIFFSKALKNELVKLQNHRCRSTRTMI